jgi:hypothetical protein
MLLCGIKSICLLVGCTPSPGVVVRAFSMSNKSKALSLRGKLAKLQSLSRISQQRQILLQLPAATVRCIFVMELNSLCPKVSFSL